LSINGEIETRTSQLGGGDQAQPQQQPVEEIIYIGKHFLGAGVRYTKIMNKQHVLFILHKHAQHHIHKGWKNPVWSSFGHRPSETGKNGKGQDFGPK
jgi:hypothetical protein